MEKFRTLDGSEHTIAILGNRWSPQTTKQDRGKMSKKYILHGENVISTQTLEVSITSWDGAPSRKGCVINGQMRGPI